LYRINLYRAKEWFSWHFPELPKIVSDNEIFVKLAYYMQTRENISEESLGEIEEIVGDADVAQKVVDASKISMG
jgi:nucleolar protein 56